LGLPLGDEVPRTEPPKVNMTIILVNFVVYVLGLLAPWLLVSGARSYNDVINAPGLVPAYILSGQRLYTIMTSMFIHAGLMHILGNMFYLYIFGDNVENIMGGLRYFVFYILSGLGAILFHITALVFTPPSAINNVKTSTGVNPWLIPAVGASGAISGVLGAYLLAFPSASIRVMVFWGFLPFFLRLPATVYIGFWFIYQVVMALSTTFAGVMAGVAFWAHVGGFLTGMALAPIFIDKKRLARARYLMAVLSGPWLLEREVRGGVPSDHNG